MWQRQRVSRSWHAKFRRRRQRNQRRKRASICAEVRTGSVWATTPPFAEVGRPFDVSRWRVGRIAPGAKSCEDTRSTTELSNPSWDVPQITQERALPLFEDVEIDGALGCVFERLHCPGSSASPWLTASYCRDGSLAVVQPLWVEKTSEVLGCTRRAMPAPTQLTLLNHPQMAAFILFLLVIYMRSSEFLSLRNKDLVPPLLPCWSIVIAAGENGVSTKTGGVRDRSVLMDQCWLQWLNKLLPALKAVRPEEKIWTFDRKTATDILGRSGMTVCQTRQWSQHRPGAGFQYSATSARNEGGRLPLSPAPAPRQAGNTRATCRGNVDNATTSPAPHKRLTGKLLLHLFGGSGFLAESDRSFGFALLCARHEVSFQV